MAPVLPFQVTVTSRPLATAVRPVGVAGAAGSVMVGLVSSTAAVTPPAITNTAASPIRIHFFAPPVLGMVGDGPVSGGPANCWG